MVDLTKYDIVFFDVGNIILHDIPVESYYYYNIFKKISDSSNITIDTFLYMREEEIVKGNHNWIDCFFDSHIHQKMISEYSWHKVLKRWSDLMFTIDNAIETIEKISKQIPAAIIANQPKQMRNVLDNIGVSKYMKIIVLDGEYNISKPDPRIFQYALDQMNIIPERALMIGDRLDNDIFPAKLLNMEAVWVKYKPINISLSDNLVSSDWQNKYFNSLCKFDYNNVLLRGIDHHLQPDYILENINDLFV